MHSAIVDHQTGIVAAYLKTTNAEANAKYGALMELAAYVIAQQNYQVPKEQITDGLSGLERLLNRASRAEIAQYRLSASQDRWLKRSVPIIDTIDRQALEGTRRLLSAAARGSSNRTAYYRTC
ncbi:MAG: hypothetical protein R3C05_08655 [Pirellulaceae bacterium]